MGCLVHELLTTELPFLQPEWVANQSAFWSDVDPPERQADMDMIIEFCRDKRGFPRQALQKARASLSESDFVMGLLLPDPGRRMTAAEALKSPWLTAGPLVAIPKLTYLPGSRQRLEQFIRRAELQMFFPEVKPTVENQAKTLAEELVKRGCTKGIAASLEVLVLYDLVILIGNASS